MLGVAVEEGELRRVFVVGSFFERLFFLFLFLLEEFES